MGSRSVCTPTLDDVDFRPKFWLFASDAIRESGRKDCMERGNVTASSLGSNVTLQDSRWFLSRAAFKYVNDRNEHCAPAILQVDVTSPAGCLAARLHVLSRRRLPNWSIPRGSSGHMHQPHPARIARGQQAGGACHYNVHTLCTLHYCTSLDGVVCALAAPVRVLSGIRRVSFSEPFSACDAF